MKKNFDFVKYFFAFLIFFFVSSHLMAIPADTTMKSKRQSDNRLLDFYLIGDEFVNFARSIDNYTLLLNENGDYCYAYLNENGDLVASSYLASNPNQRTKTEIDFLSSINKRLTFSDNQITNRKSAFQKYLLPGTTRRQFELQQYSYIGECGLVDQRGGIFLVFPL